MVKAAVIREIAEGLIPQQQNIQGQIPFNLMKSETLVRPDQAGGDRLPSEQQPAKDYEAP